MSDDEMLKFLERAEWLFEMGIPGLLVGVTAVIYSAFSQELAVLFIGIGILITSTALIEFGRHFRDKVPPHEL